MKKILFHVLLVMILFVADSHACTFAMAESVDVEQNQYEDRIDGYPIANFALIANVHQSGSLYGDVMQNPGTLGSWLDSKGAINVSIEKRHKYYELCDFEEKVVDRTFPIVKCKYEDPDIIGSTIRVETYCPLGINNIDVSALPVIMLEIGVENSSGNKDDFNIVVDIPAMTVSDDYDRDGIYGVLYDDEILISADTRGIRDDESRFRIPVSLEANQNKLIHVLVAMQDAEWYSASKYPDVVSLSDYVHDNWHSLRLHTERFAEAIPETRDADLNNYLRWYMIPAICLTKCTRQGDVLTMGYRELNQRDSFWTSWVHLVLFEDLERKMIEESICYQQDSGKIPTTILPLIERSDDLDINAFFVLRVARFYQYHKNKEELACYWPSLVKAMDWLISRDLDGEGLPCQVSFWGDWKDVVGVEGRKYSPFSGLVYLSALKSMVYLSDEIGDADSKRKYVDAYDKGYEFINRPVSEGGLWNGRYYCQIWKDGSVNDRLLQDQTVGILFGVVPKKRAKSIFNSLNRLSKTEYGIAETFPYYSAEWGYEPGCYHNGAVWPWVSFMDCWARIGCGRKHEAIKLIKRVAAADLVSSGDWTPNEHINSITGENLGFKIQGWNAALYGLVYFGLINPGMLDWNYKIN